MLPPETIVKPTADTSGGMPSKNFTRSHPIVGNRYSQTSVRQVGRVSCVGMEKGSAKDGCHGSVPATHEVTHRIHRRSTYRDTLQIVVPSAWDRHGAWGTGELSPGWAPG